MDLSTTRIPVTGGTSGVGRALAAALTARDGRPLAAVAEDEVGARWNCSGAARR